MKMSKAKLLQEAPGDQQPWVGSKKSVQQGRSPFCARSVLAVREHGKRARTPLAAFFNRPLLASQESCDSSSRVLSCMFSA